MRQYRNFVQIAPVVINDGVRDKLIVFALDDHGGAWMAIGVDEGNVEWVRVEQPTFSTGKDNRHPGRIA
jgi:hypothetical protein